MDFDLMRELQRAYEQLMGRFTGPFQFRLYGQPAMALFLAVRAGIADARLGRPPFLRTLVLSRGERRGLIRSGWGDIRRVFIFAIIIDVIYQATVFGTYYPLQSLITAAVLAIVPYILLRGLITRATRRVLKRRGYVPPPPQASRSGEVRS